jgi:hypothetical protein
MDVKNPFLHADHSTIRYLANKPITNGRVTQSLLLLQEFNITIKGFPNHQNWVAELPNSLWSYRTTWRNMTSYSPYHLVFGKEPIFPTEFEIKTLKMAQEIGLDLTKELWIYDPHSLLGSKVDRSFKDTSIRQYPKCITTNLSECHIGELVK